MKHRNSTIIVRSCFLNSATEKYFCWFVGHTSVAGTANMLFYHLIKHYFGFDVTC